MDNARFTIINANKQQYIFDKYIFTGFILLLLIIFLSFIFMYGGLDANKQMYINCNDTSNRFYSNISTSCYNPVYQDYKYCTKLWYGACEQEFLTNGFSYGTKPPNIMKWFSTITFFGLVLSFILNHLINNRKFSFKEVKK